MSKPLDVAAVVGSLRRDSYTRQLVKAITGLAQASLKIEILSIGELSLYNQDDEAAPPQQWVDFRARIKRADAVLFATPEYNRSISGCLKNAIDVGSRPYGKSAWSGKPAAVISASPGALGGFGANHDLRQILVAVDMPTMQQPEAYMGGSDKLVNPAGEFANPVTKEFFVRFLSSFEIWTRRFALTSSA